MREDFWGDLKVETRRALKRLLESSLEVEVQDLIGSRRWEHNANRRGYRNGHYVRGLLTGFGYVEELIVPRVREGGNNFKTIKRYQQRTREVDEMVKEIILRPYGSGHG